MSETTKEQIQQSMAAYGALLKHINRWCLTWLFTSHYLEVFIIWTSRRIWSAACRPSVRCVAMSASNIQQTWCWQEGCPLHGGRFPTILRQEVYAEWPWWKIWPSPWPLTAKCWPKSAVNLKTTVNSTLITQFGGYYICLWRRIWSRVWPKSARCWIRSAPDPSYPSQL